MATTMTPATPRDDSTTTILLVSACGGFTHAAPVLELGRILAARGHRIEFVTHQGQERWVVDNPAYGFIAKTHTMGPGMDAAAEAAHYAQMQGSDIRTDFAGFFAPKFRVDAFWADDYRHLMALTPAVRPDMIVADFFVDAAVRDVAIQTGVPIAVVWPQMPYMIASAPHIPGIPGFQVDALTSEHASLWTRMRAALRPVRSVPSVMRYFRFIGRMRRDAGMTYSLPMKNKPDHLVLVNSFWGLETPKDLPPLVAPIGPILSEEYAPLDEALETFFQAHSRVVFLAFGTHVNVLPVDLEKILFALAKLLTEGSIDGIIWAAGSAQRANLTATADYIPEQKTLLSDALANKTREWFFTPFAPQRAVLARPETKLFVTHGGGSSVNEGFFHGVPMLVLGFFADQPINGLRVVEAGCGAALDKARFTASETYAKARAILRDDSGTIGQDVQRMRHIARISSRRKAHGADLVEEVMYDAMYSRVMPGEKAAKNCGTGRRRPMHLQTADARMPGWKVRNLDLALVGVLSVAGLAGAGYYAYRLLEAPLERVW